MTVKALHVTITTLIGVIGKAPFSYGNCFSVRADDGNAYRIVNMVLENLDVLIKSGLTYPIDIKVLGDGVAVMHDRRIPDDWYKSDFCETCCPYELLPMPQQLQRERHIMQGKRVERSNSYTVYPGTPDCCIVPEV